CSEIRSQPGTYQHVRILAFSTWQNVPAGADLTALKQCLGEQEPRSAALAFCLPIPDHPEGSGCSNSLRTLHSYLPATQWREVSATAYVELPPAKKAIVLEPLYSSTASILLRVKYCPNEVASSPASALALPPANQDLTYITLRTAPGATPLLDLRIDTD